MRSALTMIELIFVIIILGILASSAIPKLAATRDDAEVAAAVQSISHMIVEINSYYAAHGLFAEAEKMTRAKLMKSDMTAFEGDFTGKIAYFGNSARTKKCLAITVDDVNGTLNIMTSSDGSSYCNALIHQLGPMIGTHKVAGSAIYQ